jgi:hypothetical protein
LQCEFGDWIDTVYATFGVHAFEFDAGLGLELRLEEEPEDLPKALARIHQELLSAGHRSRGTAATYYDRAVKACSYNSGTGYYFTIHLAR